MAWPRFPRSHAGRQDVRQTWMTPGAGGGRSAVVAPTPTAPAPMKTATPGDQLPGKIIGADGEQLELRFNGGGDVALELDSQSGDGQVRLYASDGDVFMAVNVPSALGGPMMGSIELTTAGLLNFLLQNHARQFNVLATTDSIWVEIRESTVDPTPSSSSNVAALFSRDNGSGKTQLCVRFGTGAVQVLATEP